MFVERLPGIHKTLNPPVPPPGVSVAEPIHKLLQETFTCEVEEVIAGGFTKTTESTAEQPLPSVTEIVCVPAQRFEAVAVL